MPIFNQQTAHSNRPHPLSNYVIPVIPSYLKIKFSHKNKQKAHLKQATKSWCDTFRFCVIPANGKMITGSVQLFFLLFGLNFPDCSFLPLFKSLNTANFQLLLTLGMTRQTLVFGSSITCEISLFNLGSGRLYFCVCLL